MGATGEARIAEVFVDLADVSVDDFDVVEVLHVLTGCCAASSGKSCGTGGVLRCCGDVIVGVDVRGEWGPARGGDVLR
ncbi:MAG TPA: hypothetical protein VGS97_01405 [Actinocrinis sp.]|uniref:hypothetical protein n=1 Tax=Actinocrinis sp. TaxID=1920516 RepID=UPI002DDD7E63|nr:hypothetical protein [Actinocrinis sp.]HEV2342722.1 hypothetical protein [Actinocrinis sp.]